MEDGMREKRKKIVCTSWFNIVQKERKIHKKQKLYDTNKRMKG